MREFKFRAFLDNEMCEVIGIFTNTKEAVCVVTNRILLDDEREQYHIEQTPIEIPFDNIKLMQSTGLKDKHGKDIFESDLIKLPNGEIEEVIFKDGLFCYINCLHNLCNVNTHSEVVGNIYENPNLINGD